MIRRVRATSTTNMQQKKEVYPCQKLMWCQFSLVFVWKREAAAKMFYSIFERSWKTPYIWTWCHVGCMPKWRIGERQNAVLKRNELRKKNAIVWHAHRTFRDVTNRSKYSNTNIVATHRDRDWIDAYIPDRIGYVQIKCWKLTMYRHKPKSIGWLYMIFYRASIPIWWSHTVWANTIAQNGFACHLVRLVQERTMAR